MSLFVYNLNQELIFKTHENNLFSDRCAAKAAHDRDIGQYYRLFGRSSQSTQKETREKIGYAQTFYELTSFYEIRSKLLLTLIILEVVSLILSSVFRFFLICLFLAATESFAGYNGNRSKESPIDRAYA